MNRKVNYITHALLILFITAGGFFLFQNSKKEVSDIPSDVRNDTKTTVTVSLSSNATLGKSLFMRNCASCHSIFKHDGDLMRLLGFTERNPWTTRQNVYDFIRDPHAFNIKHNLVEKKKEVYGNIWMTPFPDLTNDEIDAICDYLSEAVKVRW